MQLQWIIIEKNMNIYNDSNLLRKFYLGENSSPSQLIVHSYGAKIFQYFTINIDEINKDKDYNYNKRFYIFNDLNKIILYDGVIILSGYNEYAERIRGQIKSDYQRHLQYKKLYKV